MAQEIIIGLVTCHTYRVSINGATHLHPSLVVTLSTASVRETPLTKAQNVVERQQNPTNADLS